MSRLDTAALENLEKTVGPERSEQAAPDIRLLSELVRHEADAPDQLLKYRYLCKGGGLLLSGPTGIGKSSFALQCMIQWSVGRDSFGIEPARPLKSLIIQAENDEGDLAEMRDGILRGLDLTPTQRAAACSKIVVCREDSRTGSKFFLEVLHPALETHTPDLVWIDPALAYLGGETNSQKDVGGFLRNWLNPIIREFDCGCVVIHHTNKPPSGKEKPQWAAGDFAYLGSGSAEWANWPRAVLSLRALGEYATFELRAGKRGSRLAWKDRSGKNTSYAKYIAHATEPGVIHWRELEDYEPSTGGRPSAFDEKQLLELLVEKSLSSTEWEKLASEECGISRRTFFRLRRSLELSKRVLRSVSGKWTRILTT